MTSHSGKTKDILSRLLPSPDQSKDWFLCADGGGGIALLKDKHSQREYLEKLFKDKNLAAADLQKICDKLLFMRICFDSLEDSFRDLVRDYSIAKNSCSELCQIVNYDDIKVPDNINECNISESADKIGKS